MNIWHDIDQKRVTPERYFGIIEISKGSKTKYEVDKESGLLMVDRVLYTSTHYPANYGFIPCTYADDGDPLDIIVLCTEPIIPMTLVECYPIGVIKMRDSGFLDEKIISIPFGDPNYVTIKDIGDLPEHVFNEMKHFFSVYKTLEHKETVVNDIAGREEAISIIAGAIENYRKKFST